MVQAKVCLGGILFVSVCRLDTAWQRDYILWTLDLAVQRRKVFPFHQKRIPKRQKNRIKLAFVMIGGMNLNSVSIEQWKPKQVTNVPILNTPRCDELSKAITPQILVDRDGYEERSSDWLVRIDSVGTSNSWQSSDLDSSACEANNDNGFPRPLLLVSHGNNNIT